MKGIFVYVLEYMLTLAKCEKSSKLRLEHLKVFQAFHTVRIVLYIGCSGQVIGLSTATY